MRVSGVSNGGTLAEAALLSVGVTARGTEFFGREKAQKAQKHFEMDGQNRHRLFYRGLRGLRFTSEREWLENELRSTLEVNLREEIDADFFLPATTGFRRSETLVLYSLRAYQSCREIITAVQQVLCESRDDWIIYFQGLASEGPDFEELPDDARDFTVWIYPDKIMATEENAVAIREVMD
jgi:hypothetical protein